MAGRTSQEQDWSSLLKASHSFTTEQLQHFNAAGVDPYLVQFAQVLGSHFTIPQQGLRNLANAFSSLPQAEFYGQRMGIGFSDRHIAKVLAESDGGFAFLSIIGCLGEYVSEDLVVAVILKLVRVLASAGLPEGFEPSDFQWKRLVHLCHGVLATSPFGPLITKDVKGTEATDEHVGSSQIVKALLDMNTAASRKSTNVSLDHAGADALFFAAVAEYLFDLEVVVLDADGKDEAGRDATNAQCVIRSGQPLPDEDPFDLSTLGTALPDISDSRGSGHVWKARTPADFPRIKSPVTGGRVTWNNLFRCCFGQTFTDIEPALIADFTGGAASLLASSLQYGNTKSQEFFLPHASTVRGLSGFGLVETVTSWFPELRKMAPQMGKAARQPFQPARDRMDEVSRILESRCKCGVCGNASASSTEFCSHSVVEVIMELGLYIARAVVIPNLYPKRSGVLAFYERLHAGRMLYRSQEAPATEAFMQGFIAAFPTPRNMIETMCMLFTGSVPMNTKESTLAITHEGITVSLTAWASKSGVPDPENEHVLIRQRAGVNVSSGTSHLYGRICNQAYWVPAFKAVESNDQAPPLTFSESIEMLRTKPKELKQIVKPRMGGLMFSYIRVDKHEEDQATKLGWVVI
ncbi:hypothetical protein H2200_005542 [Cladophialophora chaetospira]|uniref:Uncharacterized protein n=1 Tax=Cladophialophora chaetospira TaxID=386627 RepID=A0AA38XC65_9EURO|nr:hypothetical protein H2200_005542 [Cladophialophora chaetospira]